MSTMASINILLLAFIVGCAFVRADPVANPECRAAAETKTSPEFQQALLSISAAAKVIVELVSDLKVTVDVGAKIKICLIILEKMKVIAPTYLGSCDKMKPTDVVSLLVNLKLVIQICLAAVVELQGLVSIMVNVYLQLVIKLCTSVLVFIGVCLKLALSVNISVLGSLLNICISLGKTIYVDIFANVFALVKLCLDVSASGSVNINALTQVCLSICAPIKISVNLMISIVIGLLTGTPGVPKQCISLIGDTGLQITVVIDAIIKLCVGVQVNLDATIQAILKLEIAIDALINLEIGADVKALVKLALSACLNGLENTCECYKKTGSSLIGISILVNATKLVAAVQVALKALLGVGLLGVVGTLGL